MKRFAKRIALLGTALLLLLVLVPLLFEKQLGEKALSAVRQQLRTELAVEGYSLSLLRDFPYASVGLRGVELAGYPKGNFIKAEQLSGRISYFDLLFADGWVINTVTLENAELFVSRDAAKQGNWSILKPKADTSSSEFQFALSQIMLNNCELHYTDHSTETNAKFYIDAASLAGEFGTAAYTLTGSVQGKSHYLQLADLTYIKDFQLGAELELRINPQETSYLFGPTTIVLDEMPIDVSGSIGFIRNSTTYDLQLATQEGRLGPLLKALPEQWVSAGIRSLDTRGSFSLAGSITGLYDDRHAPAINFSGKLRDGSLDIPALDRSAKDVSFALDYSNGKGHSMADSKLRLVNILGTLDGQPLNGRFTWDNFSDPLFALEFTGTLPLAWLDPLVTDASFRGELELKDMLIQGRQRHLMSPKHARYVKTGGELIPLAAGFDFKGESFTIDADQLNLVGQNLKLVGGRFTGLDNTFGINLDITNVIPYLLGDEQTILRFDGGVETEQLDLDRWVGLFNAEGNSSPKGVQTRAADDGLVDGFAARLRLAADRVQYGLVDAKRFTGTCTLDKSVLQVDGEGYAMEGHWAVEGDVHLYVAPSLSAKLACSEVNMTELLEQTENLGQQVVEARHLSGQMTTRAYVEAAWDEQGNFLPHDLHVWSNIGLTDGELQGFEMLQALSSYVRAEELAHIRFTDVENWIEIEGSKVYLPAMFIQSSATNFIVAGEHSFTHEIDYGIRVNGAQVILAKLFGKRPGMQYMPDRRSGWVKTNFKIQGNLEEDDYAVRMAGPEVRRQIRYSQRRKADIRRKLVALFGPESLIDDYDDNGERIEGRPQRSRTFTYADVRTESTEEERLQRAVDIDTETYLEDWDDEDAGAAEKTTQANEPVALSRKSRSLKEGDEVGVALELDPTSQTTQQTRKPSIEAQKQQSPGLLEGLFKSNPPKKPLPPGENTNPALDEEGYLEGFENITPAKKPD